MTTSNDKDYELSDYDRDVERSLSRTLTINEAEAKTVHQIFNLYDRFDCVRQVKKESDRLGLITKQRVRSDGTTVGGVPFSRWRIYHLLSNPVYIGRIRHRDESYDGRFSRPGNRN